MKQFNTINWVMLFLLVVGGLNWGLVGIFNFNLVASIFGDGSAIARIVYALVGVSAVYVAIAVPGKVRSSVSVAPQT